MNKEQQIEELHDFILNNLYKGSTHLLAEKLYNAGYRKVGSDAKGNLLKIQNLCIEFDEMGYEPTTLCENPEQTAKKWKSDLMYEIGLFLDEAMGIKARYNELKAENERVKAENAKLQEQFAEYQLASDKEILAQVKQAKIDVLNELKKKTHNYYPSIDSYCLSQRVVLVRDIDELLKEYENGKDKE